MNSSPPPHAGSTPIDAAGPPPVLLAASFFLAGLGTVLLGPLLPALLQEWTLSDQRGGLLLLAKFVGAFIGGVSVPQRLRRGIVAGHLLAAIGFAVFALAGGLATALPALFLAGLGLGEIIASTNVLAGRRYPAHTGSALALINLFWSLGAVSTGLLVAALLPHFGWRRPVLGMAALLLLVGLAGLPFGNRGQARAPTEAPRGGDKLSRFGKGMEWRVLGYAALLFFYGGLETCLTAWLTTFALRSLGGGAVLGGQSPFVILWASLTAGRGLASLAMRAFPERSVLRVSLLATLALIVALGATHSPARLLFTCILLGFSLAPVFPSIFGLLLRGNPPPRAAGAALAVSGLGAALFPWLMGVVSTVSGSLRLAMVVPACLVPVIFLLTFPRWFRALPSLVDAGTPIPS